MTGTEQIGVTGPGGDIGAAGIIDPAIIRSDHGKAGLVLPDCTLSGGERGDSFLTILQQDDGTAEWRDKAG